MAEERPRGSERNETTTPKGRVVFGGAPGGLSVASPPTIGFCCGSIPIFPLRVLQCTLQTSKAVQEEKERPPAGVDRQSDSSGWGG